MTQACDYLKNDPRPVRDRIEFAIDELVKGIREHEDYHRYHLLVAMASASDSIPRTALNIIRDNQDYPYRVMETIFREGQHEGTIHRQDPRNQAILFWTQIIGLAMYKSSHRADDFNPDPSLIHRMFIKE